MSADENFASGAQRLSAAAALLLGWRPADFWTATPAELAACLGPQASADAPDRGTIETLMQRFPDL